MVARPQATGDGTPERTLFDKTNLTNFSDAVIAIAITILVLGLRFPDIPSADISSIFVRTLLDQIPEFISYVVSFLVIASYWTKYHVFMKHVKRLDSVFVAQNIFFLLFIAFLPYPTSMLGRYAGYAGVDIFYVVTVTFISVSMFLMRHYATKDGRLTETVNKEEIRNLNRTSLVNLTALLATIPIAFIDPGLSIAILCIVLASTSLPWRSLMDKFVKKGENGKDQKWSN